MQLMVIRQEFLRARDQSAEDLRWEPRFFFRGAMGKNDGNTCSQDIAFWYSNVAREKPPLKPPFLVDIPLKPPFSLEISQPC